MGLIALIVIVIGIIIIYKFLGWYRIRKFIEKIPGPKTRILIGHMSSLNCSPVELFRRAREWAKEYHPIYRISIAHVDTVNILTPEDCEVIMSSRKHTGKGEAYKVLKDWLGTGLLTSEGRKWQTRRKILTPAFHFNILKDFLPIFNEQTDALIVKLMAMHSQDVDVCPIMADFAFLTINETAMGHKLDKSNKVSQEYLDAVRSIEECFLYRLFRPLLYFPPYYWMTSCGRRERRLINIMHSFTKRVISKRETVLEKLPEGFDSSFLKKKKRLAFLDILLDAKNNGECIDYEGIREEVETFMFEGHDTVSTALSFLMMLLANHPEIQDQILDEIDQILGPGDRKPDFEDLQSMNLLERCIKESLRLYPSVHFTGRLIDEDITSSSGFLIPNGSLAQIHIFDIHRDPRIYPNPEKFEPDRFLPENVQERHPFAYLPFSAGPRNCIGKYYRVKKFHQ